MKTFISRLSSASLPSTTASVLRLSVSTSVFLPVLIAALLILPASCARRPLDTDPYIAENDLPDIVQCIPAPPTEDSPEFAYDQIRYEWGKQQRKNPERLAMAVRDAVWSLDTTLAIMSVPFGLEVSAEGTPEIYEVLVRGITTIEIIRFRPKAHYFRIRPFAFYGEPSVFPEDDDWLATEGSYPSGHTIRTWACAMLMAEINPASAEAVFARAWDAGESRVIAGCHWQSDIDASRPVASIGYARLQTSKEFRRQMARAQREFRRLSARR